VLSSPTGATSELSDHSGNIRDGGIKERSSRAWAAGRSAARCPRKDLA